MTGKGVCRTRGRRRPELVGHALPQILLHAVKDTAQDRRVGPPCLVEERLRDDAAPLVRPWCRGTVRGKRRSAGMSLDRHPHVRYLGQAPAAAEIGQQGLQLLRHPAANRLRQPMERNRLAHRWPFMSNRSCSSSLAVDTMREEAW